VKGVNDMPKGRSRDGIANLPDVRVNELKPNEVADALGGYSAILSLPPCRKSDPVGVQERLLKFWEFCEKGHRPTVEMACLFLGVSRMTLLEWTRDPYSEAGELVSRTKAAINAFLTDATFNGSVPFAYTIWSQKNNFGYKDTVDLNYFEKAAKTNALNELPDKASILERIEVSGELSDISDEQYNFKEEKNND